MARVVLDFEPKYPDSQIRLKTGEHVVVLDQTTDKWWCGRNEAGEVGIFRPTCVTLDFSHSNTAATGTRTNQKLQDAGSQHDGALGGHAPSLPLPVSAGKSRALLIHLVWHDA